MQTLHSLLDREVQAINQNSAQINLNTVPPPTTTLCSCSPGRFSPPNSCCLVIFFSCSAVMEFCCGLSRGQITVTPPLSLARRISVYFSSHSGIFRQTNPAHSSVCSTPFISLLNSISCKVKFRYIFFYTVWVSVICCICIVAYHKSLP